MNIFFHKYFNVMRTKGSCAYSSNIKFREFIFVDNLLV